MTWIAFIGGGTLVYAAAFSPWSTANAYAIIVGAAIVIAALFKHEES